MENLVVMKFGGSCLKDEKSFSQIQYIVKKYREFSKVIIVTSALKGITDKLIDFYKKSCEEEPKCDYIIDDIFTIHKNVINQILINEESEFKKAFEFLKKEIGELKQIGGVIKLIRPSMEIQDIIISYGEKLSTFILSQYLKSKNHKAEYISSDEILLTDDNFGRALPLLEETEIMVTDRITPMLQSELIEIICVTGFYGSTKDKKITTFGRGGSDLTAAILAYCLRNSFNLKVIYWKNVKGFLNADPRIAEKTALLKNISYKEAKELAFFGSKVLHPICLDVNEKGKQR
jgi:aspartate kinase